MSAKRIMTRFHGGPFDGHETERAFPQDLEIHITTAAGYRQTGGNPPANLKRGRYKRLGTAGGGTAVYHWEGMPS